MEDYIMKKISTILLAAAFVISAGMSFAAGNSTDYYKNYQDKRDAAIKKHDTKMNEIQKKQEDAKKQREAQREAFLKKQEEQKKQQQAKQEAFKKQQEQRKKNIDAVKNDFKGIKDSFK